MTSTRLLPALSLAILLVVAPAVAAEQKVHKYSPERLLDLLKKEGYGSPTLLAEKKVVTFKSEGLTIFVLIDDDGDQSFVCGFKGRTVEPSEMNEWNRSRRFARAFVDKDGGAFLQYDVVGVLGLSDEVTKKNVALFAASARTFRTFLAGRSI